MNSFVFVLGQEKVSELIVSLFLESSSRVQKEMSKVILILLVLLS